jgi:hypothetical protein
LAQSEQAGEELADEDNARTLVPVKALTDADWDEEEGDEVLEDEELIASPEDQEGSAEESLSEELGDEDQPQDDDDDDDDDDESVPDDAEPDDVDADDDNEGEEDDEDEDEEAEVAGEADEHAPRKRTAEE